MLKIHLIALNYSGQAPQWKLGEVWVDKPDIVALGNLCKSFHDLRPSDWLLFLSSRVDTPDPQTILNLAAQQIDLWHAGLQLGLAGQPGLIDFVAPTWMFNRDPDPHMEAASWRVSLDACLVRGQVIQQLGFLNPAFDNLAAAALEWGHRCLQSGVLVQHTPGMLPEGFQNQPTTEIPFADQLRFVFLRFGRKWALWAVLRAILTGYASISQAYQAWAQLRRLAPSPARLYQPPPVKTKNIDIAGGDQKKSPLLNVSVLIPTLERYPYLRTLLRQLGEQSYPPDEILVIDQTPPDLRQPQLYQKFAHLPLRVFYLDQAGQCSARNLGLQAAKGDAILFLDDDDEIPADLVEDHLRHLEENAIDASCGVADEVGAGPLPVAFTYRRASDVFPTNNTLLRKNVLSKSGLFDLAYEHGARADGDLGMRLYLNGARLVLQPTIRVLHHHALRGGLRSHKARRVTYASSRRSLWQRQLPGVTQFYLIRRYFTPRQVREQTWLHLLGTFSLHHPGYRRWLKLILSGLLLPHTLWVFWRRSRAARSMLENYPQIPTLSVEDHP